MYELLRLKDSKFNQDDKPKYIPFSGNSHISSLFHIGLKAKLEDFYTDAFYAARDGLRDELESDDEERLRKIIRRRARAQRLADNWILIESTNPNSEDAEGMMRTPMNSSGLVFYDSDQLVHFCILKWDESWVPRTIVLYTGFPRERAANWEGGGRDWLEFNMPLTAIDVKFIRWLQQDVRCQREFRLFPASRSLLSKNLDFDCLNYSWIRCAINISDSMFKNAVGFDYSTWRQTTNFFCDRLIMVRQYIASGAILRVMRKAQCLNSHEYKLLKLRNDENIYMSVSPHKKTVTCAESWAADMNISLDFAKQAIETIGEIMIPVRCNESNKEPTVSVKVCVHPPEHEIAGLANVYSRIKMQLQQKKASGARKSQLGELPLIAATNPPRPTWCWIETEVFNPRNVDLGDGELAAIADIFASLRSNLLAYIKDEYKSSICSCKGN